MTATPVSSIMLEKQHDSALIKGSKPRSALRTLQLGHSWFAEKPGGLERYFGELLEYLPQADVSSCGIVIGSEAVDKQTQGGVKAAAKQSDALWKRWSAMRKCVAQEVAQTHYDLIASHHSLYTFPVLSLVKDIPLVVHFHGPFAAESWAENSRWIGNIAKLLMERSVYSRAVRCIALSKAFATVLHESFDVPMERIRIIPGAVETARFNAKETRPQARVRLGWPTDRPIVFSVRPLYRRMGLENLIEAIKIVRLRVPDVLVMIAGKGWMYHELQKQIRAAGLNNHVRLLGFLHDLELPVAYRAADLTVVPTVTLEGFGLTTVESMAAGTPPIVTPIGGSPEVVGGLSPDLVVPDWTPAALAAALTAALRGDLNLPTAAQLMAFAKENFDWSITAQKVRDVYDEAISASHPESA